MKIKVKELEKIVKDILRKKYDEAEVNLIAEVIMFGELSGKTSHGIVRLEAILSKVPNRKPQLINKTKLSSILEGYESPGMLIGPLAMEEVIRLAKQNGFGLVGTKGAVSSSGSLSFYLEKIAKENLIGIIMAQSPMSTPPYNGIEPMFGTNPISFGIPSNPNPLIFDMATSAISYGALLRAKTLGKKIPENVAIDKDGNITTDPEKAIEGATLAFDNSYKGAGLAMMVELLAGLWPGAWFTIHNKDAGWGNLFMAFSPDLLMDQREFKSKVLQMIETIKNSRTKDGGKIRIPGEKTLRIRDEIVKRGYLEIDDILIQKLKSLN